MFSVLAGVPGEGPDCHFPKEIVGFGPIPARNPGSFNFYFGLKHSSVFAGLRKSTISSDIPTIYGGAGAPISGRFWGFPEPGPA